MVAGHGNDSFNPFFLGSGSPGDTGNYFFNSRLLPTAQVSQLADDVAGNDAVRELNLDVPLSGFIGRDESFVRSAQDVDLYRFTPAESGIVEVRAEGIGDFGADTFLRVFQKDGTEIAFNNDVDGLTTNSRLQVPVQAQEPFLIGVNGSNDQA